MSKITELEQQIDDLQARVAFQEDMLHSLEQTIVQQDKTILLLQQQLKRWQSKLDEVAYSLESSKVGNEKPPHY